MLLLAATYYIALSLLLPIFFTEIGGFGGSLYSQTSRAQDIILKILFALTVICFMNIMACVVEMIGLGSIVAKPAIIFN